jgi:hypothetical protein
VIVRRARFTAPALCLLLVAVAGAVASCNVQLACDCKKLPGGYTLERWEDGATYYLWAPNAPRDGVGVIDGTVVAIGWNDDIIVVKRYASFRGDGDGWMIVNIHTSTLEGPFSDAELEKRASGATLTVATAEQAFKRP